MRKALLLSLAVAGLYAVDAKAQLTLSNNYRLVYQGSDGKDRSRILTNDNTSIPETGNDKTWDFGSQKDTPPSGKFYHHNYAWTPGGAQNPAFGSASRYRVDGIEIIPAVGDTSVEVGIRQFEKLGGTGHEIAGWDVRVDQTANLGFKTGNYADKITFPMQTSTFAPVVTFVQLPLTSSSKWNGSSEIKINFTVSIQAAGLSNTPGEIRRYYINEDEVVGYGKARVPDGNGGITPYHDVLMVKHYVKTIDSIYVDGQPLGAMQAGMLGITQGKVKEVAEYRFLKTGIAIPLVIASLSPDFSSLNYLAYDNEAIYTSIKEENKHAVAVSAYPNPVSGNTLNMQFEKTDAGRWTILLTDAAGRAVMSETVTGIGAQNLQLNLPELSNSLYFYSLKNSSGAVMNTGKLMMNR